MFNLKIKLLIQSNSEHTETKSLCLNNSTQDYLTKAVLIVQLVYFTLKIIQIFVG